LITWSKSFDFNLRAYMTVGSAWRGIPSLKRFRYTPAILGLSSFLRILCALSKQVSSLPLVNPAALLLQHVLYPEITVFLDHLITEFICCCIPVEFIGIGNKHHQYIFFGKTVFL
jgi:hypothetical protein